MMNRREPLLGAAVGGAAPVMVCRCNLLDIMPDRDMNPHWAGWSGEILCGYCGGSFYIRHHCHDGPLQMCFQ